MNTESSRAITDITSGKAWEKEAPYSQGKAVNAGRFVFLSGQVSLDSDGNVLGNGNMEEQTRVVFSNIEALLSAAGCSLTDTVKLTYFVTDMSKWESVHRVRGEFFPDYHPASTTVEVTQLHKPEYLIEIEAVAVVHS